MDFFGRQDQARHNTALLVLLYALAVLLNLGTFISARRTALIGLAVALTAGLLWQLHRWPSLRSLVLVWVPMIAVGIAMIVGTLIGVLPGIVGSIQALEAIKLILGTGEDLSGRLLAYDSMEQSFRTFKVQRDPQCPTCSIDPEKIVIAEYDEFCTPH
jgi:hypothetical protein